MEQAFSRTDFICGRMELCFFRALSGHRTHSGTVRGISPPHAGLRDDEIARALSSFPRSRGALEFTGPHIFVKSDDVRMPAPATRDPKLLCTVRDCHLTLTRDGQRLVCPRGHSFDIARSGYVNLLQPQDRRSQHAGDTASALAGRRRLHDRGATRPLLEALADIAVIRHEDVVLDAGCGDGFYVGTMARQTGFEGHGVDISIAAVNAAARRYPQCEFVVANADRFIPYRDRCFSLLLSITARMNAAEFRRILRDNGRLLVAVPAPDDLVELRGVGRDRVGRTIETFARQFACLDRRNVSTTVELDPAELQDVLHAIYRPLRSEAVEKMRVTFSLDVLLFHPN